MPTVTLKVAEQERDLWVEAADGSNMSLSAWIRMACERQLEAAGPVPVHGVAEATVAQLAAPDMLEPSIGVSPTPPKTAADMLQQAAEWAVRQPELPFKGPDPRPERAKKRAGGAPTPKGMCEHRVRAGSYCKRCERVIS